MVRAIVIGVVTFIGMEVVSYLVHRFLYHKLFWNVHKSHHTEREGVFELNDLFPLFFATITMLLIFTGLETGGLSDQVAVGVGMTLYGGVYFFIHDLYIHRRAKWVKFRLPFLLKIKKAHAVHHRTGGEPYGLLLFVSPRSLLGEDMQEDDPV
ncbi:MAG: sterol desaturase family protein [Bacteroidota bacterium]